MFDRPPHAYYLQGVIEGDDRDRFCGRCGRLNPDPNLAPPVAWKVLGNVTVGSWQLVCPHCLTSADGVDTRSLPQPPC